VVENLKLTRGDEDALVDEARSVAASHIRRVGVSTERVWSVGTRALATS
jgi:hypothetical protein